MEWEEFEAVVYDALVESVGTAFRERPDERFYAAALGRIHRKPGGVIALPSLALATEPLAPRTPVNWVYSGTPWMSPDTVKRWQAMLFAEATGGSPRRWETALERYLATLARACKGARHTLRAHRITGRDFVVLLLDDQFRESLIRQVLPVSDIRRLFPELDARPVALTGSSRPTHAERASMWGQDSSS
ncbi:DUF4303 domain-containing protein [Catenuloplanes japonicus]|uniref:DUF4303 domain-containing protein n=1 Tax=Catenuloplanes japonicus TaxID=33876 RepID=UPI0006893998|nr:DUF4303 domain-containing protein [Catenuloplanes japonicus]